MAISNTKNISPISSSKKNLPYSEEALKKNENPQTDRFVAAKRRAERNFISKMPETFGSKKVENSPKKATSDIWYAEIIDLFAKYETLIDKKEPINTDISGQKLFSLLKTISKDKSHLMFSYSEFAKQNGFG